MPRHHNKSSAPGGSQRQLRVGETVRHAVADILSQGSVHDPDLEGHIITVPEVRMSPVCESRRMKRVPLWSKTCLFGRPVAVRKASRPPVADRPASWLPGVQ